MQNHSVKIKDILEKTGALKKGHFRLSSGLHSEFYLQCALVLQHPEYAEIFGKELASKIKGIEVDAVISPAMGGIVIGQEVARALKKRAIFAERVEGKFTLRRGFEIGDGEKILIVEDVVTTGGSSLEIGNMIESMGAHVAGYAAICDRSGVVNKIGVAIVEGQFKKRGSVYNVPRKRISEKRFNKPFYSLLQFDFKNYKSEECPLCLKKIPLYTPGSRFSKAG